MLEEVTGRMLSAELPKIRDYIGNGYFLPLPINVGREKDTIGYIVPVSLALAYNKHAPANETLKFQKENLRQFARCINKEYVFPRNGNPVAFIFPISARDTRPSQGFVVVDPRTYCKIAKMPNELLPENHVRESSLSPATPLNMVTLEGQSWTQDRFWGNFKELRERTEDDVLTFRRAMDIAAISVKWGRLLKQKAYFGDGTIIIKRPSVQAERSSAEITDLVDQGHYVYLNGKPHRQRALSGDHMVIPALAAEFLKCDDDGNIVGIIPENEKRIGLNFDIELSSDFESVTHINTLIETEAQRQIVERALTKLAETGKKLTLFDEGYGISSAESKSKFGQKSIGTRFSMKTQMQFCASLSPQGDFLRCQIAIQKPSANAELAVRMTKGFKLHFNGTLYSFSPT